MKIPPGRGGKISGNVNHECDDVNLLFMFQDVQDFLMGELLSVILPVILVGLGADPGTEETDA